MLVKLFDIKDEVYWVNPAYVRVVRENPKKGYTEVHCVAGSGVATGIIKIRQPIDDVAMSLNVAMIGATDLPPASTESQAANPAAQAAIGAAFIG
ncbi:MAG: hypothetical protein AAF108_07705 [Planctomycetota bacterium]